MVFDSLGVGWKRGADGPTEKKTATIKLHPSRPAIHTYIMSNNNKNNNQWSPLDCLVVAATTASGLLQKWDDEGTAEVELLVQNGVELRAAVAEEPLVPLTVDGSVDLTKSASDWTDRCGSLQAIVTTHRLVFLQNSSSSSSNSKSAATTTTATTTITARYLHLCNVFSLQEETRFMKSPKLVLSTALGDLVLVYPTGQDGKRQRDECRERLQKSLSRQQWEQDQQQQQQQQQIKRRNQQNSQARRKVGVDAILSQSRQKHRQAAHLTETAFQGDAETLLREATELVNIIHRYVATLDRSGGSSNTDDEAASNQKLMGLLQGMGMTSALRKADFKGREDAFYETTARQLCDFVRPKLAQCQGVMTLTDVYCLYNRARGSHLLAPEDLLQAVECLDRLRIGISCYTFPDSGLKVLRDDSATDEALAATFLRLCNDSSNSGGGGGGGYVTALTVSRATHVSAVLALEQLQAAERAQFLVRDETLESIRFYPNRFASEWCRGDDKETTSSQKKTSKSL